MGQPEYPDLKAAPVCPENLEFPVKPEWKDLMALPARLEATVNQDLRERLA